MPNVLIAAFGAESIDYVRRCRQLGMHVRVLDCFDEHHGQLSEWFGDDLLQVVGRRSQVRLTVAKFGFDAAIVHEHSDFVKAALITQSLREAGIRTIIVVTPDAANRRLYRRCGAHRVVVAQTEEQAWMLLCRYLPSFATA